MEFSVAAGRVCLQSVQESRADDPFKIIEKIGKNAYKLELPAGYDISPTFNVKDLRPHLEEDSIEDLRTSLCFQSCWIDTKMLA